MTAGAERRGGDARILLDAVRGLLRELRPARGGGDDVGLDSALDEDLGFDSLARAELIARVEKRFSVSLPERVFAEAESPRDLLRAIASARGRERPAVVESTPEVAAEPAAGGAPHAAATLVEVLGWHVERHPERTHIRILDREEETATLTYGELWRGALAVAAGLQRLGVEPGDVVAIMLPTGVDYFFSFFGILLGGAVPVPIYPPARRSQLEEHLARHAGILANCGAVALITVPEARLVARLLKAAAPALREATSVAELSSASDRARFPAVGADDTAFIQYTSGSTGSPKGVVLTHANLLANIRAMGRAVDAGPSDVFVSWLPLYHDMGLIGAWLGSMYFAAQLVVMSPLTFLVRPFRWLWAIAHYRGSLSAAPNFGFEACIRRVTERDLEGLDLSTWRVAFNGAEPISPVSVNGFIEKFGPAGFRPEAMMPVYGLAESSVGLTFPPLGRAPVIDCIDRERFGRERRATPAMADDHAALCFVGCGLPLPGHEVRVVDRDCRELPEREEGRLEFRGPSATSGYYRNAEATARLFSDGWLDSGDLAYVAGGEVFITGRAKDVIIRGGRNVYPQEIEELVGGVEGVRPGCVAVFGATDTQTGTERLVVVAETRESHAHARAVMVRRITGIANDLTGIPPDEVVLAPPHTVLKTSSGKIRRSACRELFELGRLLESPGSIRVQLAHAATRTLVPIWYRFRKQAAAVCFAGYAWAVFGMIGAAGYLAVMLLPVLAWRWRVLRILLRAFAASTATRLEVAGLENLPSRATPCVYVSNHASYLDGYAVIAALPRVVRFVAKAELRRKPLVGGFLARLGAEFVERFDREKGVVDAHRMTELARQGAALFFFPEGTFTRMPGLLNFHMSAFLAAADAGTAVVPVVIRGTRSILRADSWFPRHGRISIRIGAPIVAGQRAAGDDSRWRTALELRERARGFLLEHCGEPDLSREIT